MRTPLAAALLVAGMATSTHAQPAQPTQSTDPDHCRWSWSSGALPAGGSIGAWTERCTFATGVWELAYDDALPGFWLTVDGDKQEAVLQVFTKPADADVSAILPELRERGYIPDDDECTFAAPSQATLEMIGPTITTRAFYEIMPSGARLAAFEATPDDEVPEPPCGEYGWSTHGVRYFMTDLIHPGTVIYFNLGQDGTMFDPRTVTLE